MEVRALEMNKSEAWLLGRLSRGIAHRLVRIYYPRIEVTGAERIPETGPVLLCGNHPNSLIDPIVIGIACGRPVRFMAKAPLFKTPVLGPIMYGLGMIPAYRGSDDSKQVRRNLESLDSSVQVLVEGHAVGIFPEGKSHDAVQVEMVRSGVARIAVQVVEQGASELVVVPMGLNYDRKEQFGSSVWVQVGHPIAVEPWLQQKGEEGRKAIRSLTKEVERRLKSVVVHLEEPGWEPLLEDLEAMIRGESPLNIRASSQADRRRDEFLSFRRSPSRRGHRGRDGNEAKRLKIRIDDEIGGLAGQWDSPGGQICGMDGRYVGRLAASNYWGRFPSRSVWAHSNDFKACAAARSYRNFFLPVVGWTARLRQLVCWCRVVGGVDECSILGCTVAVARCVGDRCDRVELLAVCMAICDPILAAVYASFTSRRISKASAGPERSTFATNRHGRRVRTAR